jgi:2-methylisocitrate lyase-like PEP mutase family enzyme
MSEMVGNARRVAAAVDLSVIADAQLRQRIERFPHRARIRDCRRCRYPYRGSGFSEKMRPSRRQGDRAARGLARQDPRRRHVPDFVIIARTDARAVAGFDEAVAWANAALAAGADMAFVEALQTIDEVAAVPRLVKGPCLLNVVYSGKTPDLDLREAEGMGYKLAIVPGLLIKFVVGICEQKLAELKALHRHPEPPNEMTVHEVFRHVGADEWDARRTQSRTGATIRSAAE